MNDGKSEASWWYVSHCISFYNFASIQPFSECFVSAVDIEILCKYNTISFFSSALFILFAMHAVYHFMCENEQCTLHRCTSRAYGAIQMWNNWWLNALLLLHTPVAVSFCPIWGWIWLCLLMFSAIIVIVVAVAVLNSHSHSIRWTRVIRDLMRVRACICLFVVQNGSKWNTQRSVPQCNGRTRTPQKTETQK